MNIILHNKEIFMQVTERSAIRPHTKDRLKVWTMDPDGTIQVRSRTVPPRLHKSVSHICKVFI